MKRYVMQSSPGLRTKMVEDREGAWVDIKDVRALEAERDALRDVMRWLLGEAGEFPMRPEKVESKPHPLYWWRSHLRAKLAAIDAAREAT